MLECFSAKTATENSCHARSCHSLAREFADVPDLTLPESHDEFWMLSLTGRITRHMKLHLNSHAVLAAF